MSQPASKWIWYDQQLSNFGTQAAAWNFNADQHKLALFTAASIAINHAVSPATYAAFAADGHELTTANGYTVGGVSLGNSTWTNMSGAQNFALPLNGVWAASGAGITFRAPVLYHVPSGRALAYCLADSAPADRFAPAGDLLVIAVGLWTVLKQQ